MSLPQSLDGTAVVAGRRHNFAANNVANVWADMSDAVNDIINAPRAKFSASHSDDADRAEWAGSESFGAAVDMLQNGWNEHRAAVEFAVSTVADDPSIEEMMATRFGWTHDFAGGMVDIGRYVVGEPECMIAPMMVEARQPDAVVRIVINGAASAIVDSETIVQRGVMIAALVDTLMKLNRGVEVWWAWTTEGRDYADVLTQLVKIKDVDEPLDVDDLLFVTASPSMLRRFGFALAELESRPVKKAIGVGGDGLSEAGYGRPADITRDQLADAIGGTVHVAFGKLHANDDYSDPVAHVLEHLRGLDF